MKNMLIAVAVTGGAIASLLLFGRKKLLRDKAKKQLTVREEFPERSALQTMG